MVGEVGMEITMGGLDGAGLLCGISSMDTNDRTSSEGSCFRWRINVAMDGGI